MKKIEINNINSKTYKVLSGKELGEVARKFFKLDQLDLESENVTFVVPEAVFSINSSFFSAMFQQSIKKLGVQKFREKYMFECDDIIKMNIENGIFNVAGTTDFLGGQS